MWTFWVIFLSSDLLLPDFLSSEFLLLEILPLESKSILYFFVDLFTDEGLAIHFANRIFSQSFLLVRLFAVGRFIFRLFVARLIVVFLSVDETVVRSDFLLINLLLSDFSSSEIQVWFFLSDSWKSDFLHRSFHYFLAVKLREVRLFYVFFCHLTCWTNRKKSR